jgi:hypothetical protein
VLETCFNNSINSFQGFCSYGSQLPVNENSVVYGGYEINNYCDEDPYYFEAHTIGTCIKSIDAHRVDAAPGAMFTCSAGKYPSIRVKIYLYMPVWEFNESRGE